jgi:hypothetical protein
MATDVLITPAALEPLIDVLTRACQAMRKALDVPTNPDAIADERWTLPATWARSRTSGTSAGGTWQGRPALPCRWKRARPMGDPVTDM